MEKLPPVGQLEKVGSYSFQNNASVYYKTSCECQCSDITLELEMDKTLSSDGSEVFATQMSIYFEAIWNDSTDKEDNTNPYNNKKIPLWGREIWYTYIQYKNKLIRLINRFQTALDLILNGRITYDYEFLFRDKDHLDGFIAGLQNMSNDAVGTIRDRENLEYQIKELKNKLKQYETGTK